MENTPIRIAQIMGKWLGGGVEAVVMNYYRHIDRDKIQFDFICDEDSTNIPYEEIEKLGGKVILIPPYQKIFKYHKELKRVLKEGKYKIVHSHINTLSVFSLFAAKYAGVPVRIAHSHATTSNKEFLRNIIKNILRKFSKIYATDYFACSELAGRFQFGNKAYNEGKVTIINNAIDINRFLFNKDKRKKIRDELNINEETILIGNVGRLESVKNQKFVIDIFKEYLKNNNNAFLIIVGEGSLKKSLLNHIEEANLKDKVKLVGQREDIDFVYSALDVFLFPSLYEGFGLSLIEAQCSGVSCLASNNVIKEIKVSSCIKFLDLTLSAYEWAENVEPNYNRKKEKYLKNNIDNYEIRIQSKKLEKEYIKLQKREVL